MTNPRQPRRLLGGLAVLALVGGALTACDGSGVIPGAQGDDDKAPATTAVAVAETLVRTNVADKAKNVPVNTLVKVTAENGSLSSVTVRSSAGTIPGKVRDGGAGWVASEFLEPGVTYRVKSVGTTSDGTRVESTSSFTTAALPLDKQTYPSVAPLAGETVGVGMPVVVTFDVGVKDKASIEKHLHVTSTPAQPGSWRWVSDTEVHWRPKKYWQAGTKVAVDVDINGVPAGGGVFGQEDRKVDFEVGDAHVYKVNAKTHQMQVFSNGKLLRTLPITTGKAGFTTRSGVKVIIEKFETRRMNSETVGIPQGSAEAYDIDDVRWAMRLTYSGEFIHAAPWSVGSQGHANVSHGCTGMSTANAGWLYGMTRRGDVVEYVGTDRRMEPDNGYGDWNISWPDYKDASAL